MTPRDESGCSIAEGTAALLGQSRATPCPISTLLDVAMLMVALRAYVSSDPAEEGGKGESRWSDCLPDGTEKRSVAVMGTSLGEA